MPPRMPHRHHHHHDHEDDDDDNDDLHHLPPPQPKSDPKLLFALLKFIIMLLILSLFLLFLGIAAIALFHILLAVSFLHCRRRRRSPFSTASTPTAAATALAYRFDDLKKHLPPPFNYAPGASNNSDCCWICLENFKQAESCRSLPVCNHLFHVNCVDQWLTRVPNCPVCRTQLRFSPNRLSDHRVQW